MADPAQHGQLALVAELGKKTSVCWVRHSGVDHPVWHVWSDDALCLVSGGAEQPLPGPDELLDGDSVEVLMRSKDNGGRLVAWVGRADVVLPDDQQWEPVTSALLTGRLNLPDLSTAVDGWAQDSVVRRIVPTGELVESPGDLPDDAHRATPKDTGATTRGPLPRVLHRRVQRRPKLS